MIKIGAITVGQSPRTDLIPEMLPILGDSISLIQMGGLDGLTRKEIEAFVPAAGDHVLVSRLTDGSSITFGESHILSRLQDCIGALENDGVSMIVFLCTGEFPENFRSKVPLIFPNRILTAMVPAVYPGCRLGVLTPSPAQICQMTEKWSQVTSRVFVAAASPYEGLSGVETAARTLPEEADLIVLDCIGYTEEMKALVQAVTKKPVLLPRTLVAHVLKALA